MNDHLFETLITYFIFIVQYISEYLSSIDNWGYSEGGPYVLINFLTCRARRIYFLKRPPLQTGNMLWDDRVEPFGIQNHKMGHS